MGYIILGAIVVSYYLIYKATETKVNQQKEINKRFTTNQDFKKLLQKTGIDPGSDVSSISKEDFQTLKKYYKEAIRDLIEKEEGKELNSRTHEADKLAESMCNYLEITKNIKYVFDNFGFAKSIMESMLGANNIKEAGKSFKYKFKIDNIEYSLISKTRYESDLDEYMADTKTLYDYALYEYNFEIKHTNNKVVSGWFQEDDQGEISNLNLTAFKPGEWAIALSKFAEKLQNKINENLIENKDKSLAEKYL